jgi:hypothetical protein
MPGRATCAIASEASDIRRITAKQPTRPATVDIATDSERVLTQVIVAMVLHRVPYKCSMVSGVRISRGGPKQGRAVLLKHSTLSA